jgi:periplasmic copper chaperone A
MTRKNLVAVAALAIGMLAAPASAHLTVNPREATKGGFAKLAFRVPNERPDSGTTKLEVSFPVDHPFQHINVRPTPGWTYKLERQKLATPIKAEEGGEEITDYVSKITWEGATIAPGEFQEFEVSGGPLPDDVDQLTFKAVQTYASGEVVRWIEEASEGGEEPEFPAPVLKLVAGEEGDVASTPAKETGETPAGNQEQAGATTNGDDGGSNGLAVFALVVAGVALVLSGGGLLRKGPIGAKEAQSAE